MAVPSQAQRQRQTKARGAVPGIAAPPSVSVATMPPQVDLPERALSAHEQKVRKWIKSKRGVLSQVATELGLSVAFVQRVAYNRAGCLSKNMRVEHRLRALGCPLAQRVQ